MTNSAAVFGVPTWQYLCSMFINKQIFKSIYIMSNHIMSDDL